MAFHPLDSSELIEQIGHIGSFVLGIVINVVVGGTVEAYVQTRDARCLVGGLEPALSVVDEVFEFLGILLIAVSSPDVGFYVYTTADVANRACGVKSLCDVVYIADETWELYTVGPPFFVHGSPCYDRGVIAVADDFLAPFGDEVACHFGVVGIHTPRGSFTPSDVAKFVGPIVETFFEDLLVQTGSVESSLH